MPEAKTVEITLSIRHRDKDYNIIGQSANTAISVEPEDFAKFAREVAQQQLGSRRTDLSDRRNVLAWLKKKIVAAIKEVVV